MAQKRSLTGSGLAGQAANYIVGNCSSGLTATGSVQTDALALTDVNEFTTVGSGTGAILPANASPGDQILIYTATGQSTLSIYPPSGEAINAIAANSAYSQATAKTGIYTKVSPTRWSAGLLA